MTHSAARTSSDIWLEAAYTLLVEQGVDAVKIMTLAKRTGLTRTGFYWHFKDLNGLLDALIQRWEETNTGHLVCRAEAPAQSIVAAMLNVFDCWFDATLFDAPLDLAIRNWARNDATLQSRLNQADARRIEALDEMFRRFDYPADQAKVRSMTVIYTQIGYFSMQVADDLDQRLALVSQYVEVFTGRAPSLPEMQAFRARHQSGF